MIRAIFRVAKSEAGSKLYDTLFLKITYPARYGETTAENNSGVIPADTTLAPFPIVIFMSGINCGHESYGWLAKALAAAGIVTITYDWIASDLPGFISKSPGIRLDNAMPDVYGTLPTSSALPVLLRSIAELQKDSVLAGHLDTTKVIFGGHSAGGTMALHNGNPDWFPPVKAAFAYAAHTMASTFLGYEPSTILPTPSRVPTLIMGGLEDGVVAASSGRYKGEPSPTAAIERTFEEAIDRQQGDAYLALLKGANHITFLHPHDETTGRGFLEPDATGNQDELRAFSAELITTFIQKHVLGHDAASAKLDALSRSTLLAQFKQK